MDLNWFCLRSQPKHEHIAAAHLAQLPDLEVYLPRIRFKRSTRQGPAWFTEALFPSYLFARFDLLSSLRRVHHARGVAGVVHFGEQWPCVPNQVIEDLRLRVGSDAVHVIPDEPVPGERVSISGGPFHDLQALVTHLLPARERVAVLLEFLGRQRMVEVPATSIVRQKNAGSF